MGVKEEVGRLFDGFTDFNVNMLRTVSDLILDPNPVIESTNGQYVSAPRFALTILSGVIAIMYYLDPPGASGMEESTLLYYPQRIQQYLELQSKIASNYSVLFISLIFLPVYFVLNTLLFWGKKSWIFFYRVSLYQLALIFLFLVFLNGMVARYFDLPEYFRQIFFFIGIIFIAYHYVRFNLGKWYWSALRGTVVFIGCISLVFSYGSYINTMFENILEPRETYYRLPDSQNLLASNMAIEANDICMEARVHAINLKNGKVVWKSINRIPSGFFVPEEFDLAPSHLIISGEARKYYSQYFWESTYDISMVGAIGRRKGRGAGYKFFGPASNHSSSEVESTWLEGQTLYFITTDNPANNYIYNFFKDELYLSFKSVQINKITDS